MKTQLHERYKHEDVKQKSLDISLIKRLLTYLRPYRLWVAFAIGILVVSKALEAWVPIQIGFLVQSILSFTGSDADVFYQNIVSSCLFILTWIFLIYLLDTLNIMIKNWIGQKAIFTMRTEVYQHAERLPMSFYDRYPIGKLMTRTIHDVEQINQLFSESVIPLIGSIVLFIGIILGIFYINWKIGLLMTVIFPFIYWLTKYFSTHQRRSYNTLRSIVSAMNSFMQEHLMGVHVVRTFGLVQKEKNRFKEINEDHYQAHLETAHQFAFFFAGIEYLQSLTMISVFVFLAVTSVHFEAGTFFTLSLYSLMVFRPLFDLAERYNVLQSAMAAAERVFEVLDTPIEHLSSTSGPMLNEIQTIEFDQVWFAYEGENWILKGLSFTLNKGESLALVGMTGSGKTTIMNLLLRFYDFQQGNIRINGHDIQEYSIKDLRHQFSVILQDPVIFSGTIKENITLYDPELTDEQVKTSAEYVNLSSIVARFSDGFEHVLNERGSSLSVGEMQLINLARCVAHSRSVVMFDEATSNIDMKTEKMIQDSMRKILKSRTALVIAHRLSTIKDVDRILVLSQGVIVESGSHQELLELGGVYEKLYQLQFTT